MADKCFRVLLDLTDLQIKSFKYVWINVSPREVKTIADFKLSLCRKINFVKKDINLFIRDGLLLDEETILVLREDDTIKVQYEGDSQSSEYLLTDDKEYERASKKRKYSEINSSLSPKRHKSENVVVTGFEDASDKKKKKQKGSKNCLPLDDEINFKDKANTQNSVTSHKIKNKHAVSVDNNSENVVETFENVTYKKKKKQKESKNLLPLSDEINFKNETDTQNSETNNKKKNECSMSVENDPLMSSNSISFAAENDSSDKKNMHFAKNSIGSSSEHLKLKNSDVGYSSKSDIKKCNAEDILQNNNNVTDTTFAKSTNNCPKKKRKRHRKRKVLPELKNSPNNVDCAAVSKSFADEVLLNNFAERKHIIFSSPSRSPTTEIPVVTLYSDNKMIDVTNNTYDVEEITICMETDITNEYPKISTPQSKSYIDPCCAVSSVENNKKSINPDEKMAKEATKTVKINSPTPDYYIPIQNTKDSINLKSQCYDDLPPLKSMPKIGAHIAYKILELNESYCPEVSKYREGIVKAINESNDELEIELLKHEIKPRRSGKFENLKEDEVLSPEIIKTDIIGWSLLIEPKLLSK